MARLEKQFRELGADVNPAQMKNLTEEQFREPTVKKIRVGRSLSLHAERPESRDVQGLRDQKVRFGLI